MRLKAISCEIFHRELCAVAARSVNCVDLEFLPKGLHDMASTAMRDRVQGVVDAVDGSAYDAVVLGYALCNNGLQGVVARDLPLVLPRAHDCITLFLGDRKRYARYFFDNPGVYFKTTGWMERDAVGGELRQLSIQHQTGMDQTYAELVEKYGEDNAQFLYDQLCDQTRHYRKMTFIEMGVEPDGRFEKESREEADTRGWSYEKVAGSLSLLQQLVDGQWPEADFLTVQPGEHIEPSQDDGIVKAVDGRPS